MGAREENRWAARPVLAGLVRLLVVLVPLLVSILTSLLVVSLLPRPTTRTGQLLWWIVVLGSAFGAALATDRLARRALPLSVLLQLSLVFPDRAPSRLKTVRGVSVREMEARLLALRKQGENSSAMEAAETLVVLVGILGLHDKRTRGHSERVRVYVDLLSEELDLPEADRLRLRWAALLHDLGKLTIPSSLLNASTALTDEDWALLYRHPEEGARLAGGLLPWLGEWGTAVEQHHERWNGTGYPRGLSGEDISYGARIVAVADAYEVMTSNRAYSRARGSVAARKELAACAGTQFDPAVVRAFLSISLMRLRWILGPLSWITVLPFATATDRAGQVIKASAGAAAVAGLVAGGAVTGPGALSSPPSPQAIAVVPSPTTAPTTAPTTPASVPSPATAPGLPPVPAVPPPPAAPQPQPQNEPPPAPAPAPSPTRTPAPAPAPSPTPAPTPSPTPSPSPRPSPTPTPSPTPSPSATSPIPTTADYYLGAGSLSQGAPTATTPQTVTVLAGGPAATFDRAVGTPTAITGTPTLVVYLEVRKAQGSGGGQGELVATLQDCTTASGPCTDLSTATTGVGTHGAGSQEETVVLASTDAAVVPGHVLRLAVALTNQGNASDAVLSYDAATTPSRLSVTAAPPP